MEIKEIVLQIYRLPEASLANLLSLMKQRSYKKGHLLFEEGRVEKKLYLIKSGLVRAYAEKENGQVTFWFGWEGCVVLSMASYVLAQPGYESIELLEDSELYEVDIQALRALYADDAYLANWGRKLAELELIKTEKRLIAMQCKTAQERYLDLLKEHPFLLFRVQLGHIASYLGMSQVSLSRIRAEIK